MSLPKTARAAVVAEYGKPIEIRELPVPQEAELEPGALLVRVDVASICGSDVHQWDGMTQALAPAQLPIVLGHEMMGTVVAFGPGPREDSIGQPLKEGDRLLWTHVYCGQCQECRVQHTPTLCRRKKQYMRTNCERFPYLVGGFAQYCYVFPPSGRVRIPDGVPDGVASAASCALRTVIHAFDRVGRVEPHQRVVIQGAGPLGLFATAVANHAGVSELIVVGAPARRLDLAKRWGASAVVSVEELPTAEARLARVRELTGASEPTWSSSYRAPRTRSLRVLISCGRAAATPSSASSAAPSRPCRPRSSSESRPRSSACNPPISASSGKRSSSCAARPRATTSRRC